MPRENHRHRSMNISDVVKMIQSTFFNGLADAATSRQSVFFPICQRFFFSARVSFFLKLLIISACLRFFSSRSLSLRLLVFSMAYLFAEHRMRNRKCRRRRGRRATHLICSFLDKYSSSTSVIIVFSSFSFRLIEVIRSNRNAQVSNQVSMK